MAQFGIIRYPGSSGTLGSDATKHSVTPSGTPQLAATVVITPPSSADAVEVTQVSTDVNCNSTLSVNLTAHVTFQTDGRAETAQNQIDGPQGFGITTGCTTDTGYKSASETDSPLHRGDPGKAVTVRFYVATSNAGATTALCQRNADVTGSYVKTVVQQFRGQFRGSF